MGGGTGAIGVVKFGIFLPIDILDLRIQSPLGPLVRRSSVHPPSLKGCLLIYESACGHYSDF